LSIRIEEVDESLLDDEIHLCLPPRNSQQYAAFVSGVEKKRAWLGKRLRELGSVAQIAYSKRQPVAFIEYVSATSAPIPTVEGEKTALITCIYKPRFQGKGIGTKLVQAALGRLRQLDIRRAKTLVARDPHWINSGIYLKNGFQLEKTFFKPGGTEPLDLLTLNLEGAETHAEEPTTIRFVPSVSDALPVGVVHFSSGQCPFNALIHSKLLKALEKFDSRHVVLEVLDSWENCRLARECGAMYSDIFVNGRASFLGPATQEEFEEEIRKEIERIRKLG